MRRWWLVFIPIFILSVLGFVVWQGYSGYKNYIRAINTIEDIKDPQVRDQTRSEFNGYSKILYGGILVGTIPGHVWVMGLDGLRHYATDQYTTYSSFDGCSSEVLAKLNMGEAGVIEQKVTTSMDEWRDHVRVGDYVRAYPTRAQQLTDSAGTEGNLREIYGYNFWLFMPWGMEDRCNAR